MAQCHGYTVDGSFQRYAVSYARHCTPIPDGLSLEIAAPGTCLALARQHYTPGLTPRS